MYVLKSEYDFVGRRREISYMFWKLYRKEYIISLIQERAVPKEYKNNISI